MRRFVEAELPRLCGCLTALGHLFGKVRRAGAARRGTAVTTPRSFFLMQVQAYFPRPLQTWQAGAIWLRSDVEACIRDCRHLRPELGPVLPEDAVVAFERRHGVRLPPDYRGFITTVGHGGPGSFGGAGPYYGLFPIEEWNWAIQGEPDNTLLSQPFPAEPDRVYEDWLTEAAPGEDDEPYRGTLALGHQGCGDLSLLVVSGPGRGLVVDASEHLLAPRFTPDPDFLSWYERWLDTVLTGRERFR